MAECNAASGMIAWLDSHTGAVNAFATMILVVVTATYVGLTWKIMRANERSVGLLERQSAVRRDQLVGLVSRFKSCMGQLPATCGPDLLATENRICDAVLWDDHEPEDFRRLALEFAPEISGSAVTAEIALRWLRDCAVKVREATFHPRWSQYEIDEWPQAYERARYGLASVEAKVTRI